MKNDLIKRSDAIKAIRKVCGDNRALSFIERINALPTADRPQDWIPCSERLPRKEEQDVELGVLVTLGNGYSGLQFDYYYNGLWDDWNGYVVAWMPLPQPYTADRKTEPQTEMPELNNIGEAFKDFCDKTDIGWK